MTERHQVLPRTMCFVYHKDKVLLIKYGAIKGEMAGFIGTPGGHIEQDEGIIENANREIFEETGIQAKNTRLKGVIHINGFFGKKVMLFVTVSQSDTPEFINSTEGELFWVHPGEFTDTLLIEDVKIVLQRLNKMDDKEVFTAKSEFDGKGKLLKIEFEQ